MKLLNILTNFKSDESGAVTVDWVVLTAAIVGLGLAVMSSVGSGVSGLGTKIKTEIGTTRTLGYTATP